jgi:hypothetical protein
VLKELFSQQVYDCCERVERRISRCFKLQPKFWFLMENVKYTLVVSEVVAGNL